MNAQFLIGLGAAALALVSLGGVLYTWLYGRRETEIQALLRASRADGLGTAAETRARIRDDLTGAEYDKLKKIQKKNLKSTQNKVSLDERYFYAGIFTERDKREFERLRILLPAILTPALGFAAFSSMGALEFLIYGATIGLLCGLKAPGSLLDRKIKRRGDEIMFYLPLVIEQIAIGVSSSLDIGPCLQRVVAMAEERDSHNVVTELIRHCMYHIKSGASLEEALVEVGSKSGHTELKHSFMALAQVAKHGGEISRQLNELADAVAGQRETKIDAKIKKLELEATGPVALVFLGFILILLIGFGVQIKGAFGS